MGIILQQRAEGTEPQVRTSLHLFFQRHLVVHVLTNQELPTQRLACCCDSHALLRPVSNLLTTSDCHNDASKCFSGSSEVGPAKCKSGGHLKPKVKFLLPPATWQADGTDMEPYKTLALRTSRKSLVRPLAISTSRSCYGPRPSQPLGLVTAPAHLNL